MDISELNIRFEKATAEEVLTFFLQKYKNTNRYEKIALEKRLIKCYNEYMKVENNQ